MSQLGDPTLSAIGLLVTVPARPSVLREGEPCKHPGCAHHYSHPCEGCGRYAAGTRSGPDPEAVAIYLEKIARSHPTVHSVLVTAQMQDWTLEQTFGALSLLLVRENEVLVKMAIRSMERGGRDEPG